MKNTFMVLAALALLSVSGTIYAHGTGEGTEMGPHAMGPWMMWWGHGMGWFWPFMMMVFWVAVIVGVVFLVRRLMSSSDGNRSAGAGESALEILNKRYARGEISRDEYEQMKKDIS